MYKQIYINFISFERRLIWLYLGLYSFDQWIFLKEKLTIEIIFLGIKCQESKEIYEGVTENLQKVDKYICIFIGKFLCPDVMFSKFITSYFAYFTTDLGSEAFELPFPFSIIFSFLKFDLEFDFQLYQQSETGYTYTRNLSIYA